MIEIIELDFYMKENGRIPVQDFLYSLNPKLRAKAFSDIELLKQLGTELREPYVKPIKFVLLHGFIKKTMKTPQGEIKKARKFMEDYKRRSEL